MDKLLYLIPLLIMCSIPAIIHASLIKSRQGLLLKILVTLAVFSVLIITFQMLAQFVEHQVFMACFDGDINSCDNWVFSISDAFFQYSLFLAILISLTLSIWFYKINRMKNNKNISS